MAQNNQNESDAGAPPPSTVTSFDADRTTFEASAPINAVVSPVMGRRGFVLLTTDGVELVGFAPATIRIAHGRDAACGCFSYDGDTHLNFFSRNTSELCCAQLPTGPLDGNELHFVNIVDIGAEEDLLCMAGHGTGVVIAGTRSGKLIMFGDCYTDDLNTQRHTSVSPTASITAVALSPSGFFVLAASCDGHIYVAGLENNRGQIGGFSGQIVAKVAVGSPSLAAGLPRNVRCAAQWNNSVFLASCNQEHVRLFDFGMRQVAEVKTACLCISDAQFLTPATQKSSLIAVADSNSNAVSIYEADLSNGGHARKVAEMHNCGSRICVSDNSGDGMSRILATAENSKTVVILAVRYGAAVGAATSCNAVAGNKDDYDDDGAQ